MFVKKKHILVIISSSVIVALVFVSTLLGYNLYIQWKKDNLALKYRNSIYKLTAELFKKNVAISNVHVKVGEDELFSGLPLLEGSLKNNSSKTITSILIEVSFLNADGTVAHNDWFHPLGEQYFGAASLFLSTKQAKNVLLPGESLSFRHLLRNCPGEVVERLSAKSKFAKDYPKDRIKMVYSITGLSVL